MSKVCIILLALVASAVCLQMHRPNHKTLAHQAQWASFKAKFNKQYSSPAEELKRRSIFESNLKEIANHNRRFSNGIHKFRKGINQFSDMTAEEFKAKVLVPLDVSQAHKGNLIFKATNKQLQDSVDWRDKGAVTPVKDQGGCGSCWAFSSTGSMEGQTFLKTGKLPSLSEQNLVDCVTENSGCGGGWMVNSFKYVIANKGIDSEDQYPYEGVDGACRYKTPPAATLSSYVEIQAGDENALQEAVATVGPISIALDASGFGGYSSGIYDDSSSCTQNTPDHAVLAVGYGTEDGTDYWIVKNSWAEGWGEKGYIRMARGQNMCGLANWASYPVV